VPLLTEIDTPALVLDRARLAANGRRMRDRALALEVALRPHVKTIKSVAALRHALPDVAAITVSTLAEAEHFAAAGYRDILYAVGMAPAKLPRVARLRAQGVELQVVLDSLAAAELLDLPGLPVLVEIDSGAHRGGIAPDDPALLAIARRLEAGGQRLRGVMTHAGHSYRAGDVMEIQAIAAQERDAVVEAAFRLAQAGLPCPVVSVGSTPTALFATDLSGVTEMRPGVFLLMDAFQAGLGCCGEESLALSVVASVVGRRLHEGLVLIDAGGLALSQDRSTAGQPLDAGYGLVGPLDGPPWPGARVARVNQEHGFVTFAAPEDAARLGIGDRVRVWPIHACMTAAAYPAYRVTEGGDAVVAEWARVNHW
jgi:D-serine deaminase-like pyridoxal phosphate-dependent protein